MIKRFALTLFRNNKRTPYLFASQKKNEQNEQVIKDRFKQKLNQDDNQDEAQPAYQKQDRTTTGWMIYRFIFWGSTALLSYNIYLIHQHKKNNSIGQQPAGIPGLMTVAKQIYNGVNNSVEFLTKPPVEKLLPDVVHPLIQPKTLVLNLSDTLIKAEYIFGKGLVIHKRPGLNQFLKKMSQIYQVVIFSNDDPMFLSTVLPSIDPRHQMITNMFGRECMIYSEGQYIKDLKYLNRDLSKIVVVDIKKVNVRKHQQNVILLSEYKGDESDRELLALSSLLQSLSKPEVRDVRKTIEQMGEDPVKYYEQRIKQKQQKIKTSQSGRLFGFFGSKKQK